MEEMITLDIIRKGYPVFYFYYFSRVCARLGGCSKPDHYEYEAYDEFY
jgi:hypothetical protein